MQVHHSSSPSSSSSSSSSSSRRPQSPADDDYRVYRNRSTAVTVSPTSYSPNLYNRPSAPSIGLGHERRFLNSQFIYISKHHNADILCTASPGPKYKIVSSAATYRRSAALSWGQPPPSLTAEQQYPFTHQIQSRHRTSSSAPSRSPTNYPTSARVSPASYIPNYDSRYPHSARTVFTTAQRFSPSSSFTHSASPDHLQRVIRTRRRKSPRRFDRNSYNNNDRLEEEEKEQEGEEEEEDEEQVMEKQIIKVQHMREGDTVDCNPDFKHIKPTAPSYSFASPRHSEYNEHHEVDHHHHHHHHNDYHSARRSHSPSSLSSPSSSSSSSSSSSRWNSNLTDRTSFMTHSIRGGVAKSATFDTGIGPADYSPSTENMSRSLSHTHEQPTSHLFAKASRFLKPGLEYLSLEHAKVNVGQSSPGPIYHVKQGQIGEKTAKLREEFMLAGGVTSADVQRQTHGWR